MKLYLLTPVPSCFDYYNSQYQKTQLCSKLAQTHMETQKRQDVQQATNSCVKSINNRYNRLKMDQALRCSLDPFCERIPVWSSFVSNVFQLSSLFVQVQIVSYD